MTSELSQLADLRAARVRLDERELLLIERARHQGATWVQIAGALGLASRQAAEQRRQRLAAALQSRRIDADRPYGPTVAALRAAMAELHRWIELDRRWQARFPRAALVRDTIAVARDAPPGPLHALAGHVATDLADVEPSRLPPAVARAAAALTAALSTRH